MGVHLTLALQKEGYIVTHFRRGITPAPRCLRNIEIIKGDRNQIDEIHHAFQGKIYDLVIDLSGYTPAQVAPIFQYRKQFKRYLFCSSSSVIDTKSVMPYDEKSNVTTDLTGYGADKVRVERFLLEEFQTFHTAITIFRPQGIFGLFDFAQPGIIFAKLKSHEPLVVSEKKWKTRLNLLDIRDFCSALLLSIPEAKTFGKIYNLANSEPLSLEQLVGLCSRIAKRKAQIKFSEDPLPLWWHDYDLIAKNERIRKDLSCSFTPLEESLRDCFDGIQRVRTLRWKNALLTRWDKLSNFASRYFS